ncbi:hypothetical protein DDB_G0290235 [Dictyostelium discoideum AX4]|uniref:Uncharacterized protein DDB_G0290235 n=1 Tax=Dictyostelium discoideum TaxID=44689 RepID=Y8796_DICDI|nr:hypothetical protein DDB_G0290235 [Dictyostelium discoideum AX4]Q54GC9.1 RecName: Full=Uncharacterized protein DDB_G0290235 [Dictyostelium discoideum]EAL62339.1 hypothetical protein DDB_G0290235 [Dictyostelium discoideum AX4]|eukprot:XP_635849.1 hypothetical protein DDB_G0290235 [Dictyostelium discoideum AX4]
MITPHNYINNSCTTTITTTTTTTAMNKGGTLFEALVIKKQ